MDFYNLIRYHWPGNIRELENLIHRLVILRQGDTITVQDLPEEILREQKPEAENFTIPIPEEGIDLEKVKKELILQALKRKNWNQTLVAKLLNISRNSVISNM